MVTLVNGLSANASFSIKVTLSGMVILVILFDKNGRKNNCRLQEGGIYCNHALCRRKTAPKSRGFPGRKRPTYDYNTKFRDRNGAVLLWGSIPRPEDE